MVPVERMGEDGGRAGPPLYMPVKRGPLPARVEHRLYSDGGGGDMPPAGMGRGPGGRSRGP